MNRSRLSPVIAVAAAVLLAAGCATAQPAASPTASPTSTPTPTSSPAPTPAPTPEPVLAPVLAPTLPFGGDCSRMLTAAQLDDLLGEGWETEDEKHARRGTGAEYIELTPLATAGGLACRWFVGHDVPWGEIEELEITVAPAEQVPAEFTARYAEPLCESSYDATFCRQARTVGDVWLMARAGYSMGDTFGGFLARALDQAEATVSAGIDAVPVDRNASWWQVSDCESLGQDMRMGEVLGENYGTGFWEGSEQPESIMLREAGLGIRCQWITGDGELSPDGRHHIITLQSSHGGHWQWDAILAHDDVEDVAVAGAEHAVIFTPRDRLYVFAGDGVNVVSVDGGDSQEFVADIAARALAALG